MDNQVESENDKFKLKFKRKTENKKVDNSWLTFFNYYFGSKFQNKRLEWM